MTPSPVHGLNKEIDMTHQMTLEEFKTNLLLIGWELDYWEHESGRTPHLDIKKKVVIIPKMPIDGWIWLVGIYSNRSVYNRKLKANQSIYQSLLERLIEAEEQYNDSGGV